MPNDLFILLAIGAVSAFAVVLGFVSLTDRDPVETIHPAE